MEGLRTLHWVPRHPTGGKESSGKGLDPAQLLWKVLEQCKDQVTYADISGLETGVSIRQVLVLCWPAMRSSWWGPLFVAGGSELCVTSLSLAPSAGVPSDDSA